MKEDSDSGDKLPLWNKKAEVSSANDKTVTVQNLSTVARSHGCSEGSVPHRELSISLNEGTFNRPNFGPQTNTQRIEVNKFENANITHHHTHRYIDRRDSDAEGQPSTSRIRRRSRRTRKNQDVPEGYVRLPGCTYMCKKEPLRSETHVFRGYQLHGSQQKQPIAVKKIAPCVEKDIREVQHLVNLSEHPNVVRIFRSLKLESLTNSELYIVMELCKVQNLHDYLEANRKNNKPFDLTQTMLHAKQLIDGLKHIHVNRIIHGDLKPGNILFSRDGTQIKVSDFGISKQLEEGQCETELTSQGTDGFRAPETFHSDSVSMMSDIYSLGITLYSMFTNGEHPYGDDPHLQAYNMKKDKQRDFSGLPDEMGVKMKESFIRLLEKMLQFAPSDRPSIENVSSHPFFTRYNVISEGASVRRSTRGDERISRVRIIIGSCIILSILAAFTIAFGIYMQPSPPPNTYNVSRIMSDIGATLHLGSKPGTASKSLQAALCYAGGTPPTQPGIEVDEIEMDMRRKVLNMTRKTDFTKWTVYVYFNSFVDKTTFIMTRMHRGFRLCHKCKPMKDKQLKLFKINMTYNYNMRVVELSDVLPIWKGCQQISESAWDGMIFWFDNETLTLLAVNLGDLLVYKYTDGQDAKGPLQVIPLGIPFPILSYGCYKCLEKNRTPLIGVLLVRLGRHESSFLRISFV